MKNPLLGGSLETVGWVLLWQATPVEPWLTLLVCIITVGYRVWRDTREDRKNNDRKG